MARAPTRRLPPSPAAGRTIVEQLELEQFASRLQTLRKAKGWSPSDLAREVWGEQTNKRTGRVGARKRDRISVYEKARSMPDPHNLAKIAKALDTTPEELAPDIAGATIERQNPEFAITTIAGHADKSYLKINKLIPRNIGTIIMQLFDYVDLIELGLADPNEVPQLILPSSPKVSRMVFTDP